MLRTLLTSILADPRSKGVDLDDWRLTETRRSILLQKSFLRKIYLEWYGEINSQIPPGPGKVLELGSGAGFFEEFCPAVVKSEVFWLPGMNLCADGCALPFPAQTLKAVVMTDVLHHIPSVRDFFREANRCLSPGGVIIMVEPWNTNWSRWVYQRLHHEPFAPDAPRWEFETSGPLSGANGALPWIIFERDRALFEQAFPDLAIRTLRVMMPLRYLVSGGLSMRSLAPLWSFGLWKRFEHILVRWNPNLGMFAFIVIQRR